MQALDKVLGWQVLSASKAPQSLCFMFKLFRAGPGQRDGLANAERLQSSSKFIFELFRAGPGQGDGLASAERLQISSKFMFKLFRAALAKVMGWKVLSASKVPQSLHVCLNFLWPA